MKRVIILTITAGIWLQCLAQQKHHKVSYEFPEQMAQPVRDEYRKLCDKGQALYQVSCAKCHNLKEKGKEIIPDFTEEQLGAYSIRVANAQHEEMVSEMIVPAEELALITTFLTYKMKSGHPFVSSAPHKPAD